MGKSGDGATKIAAAFVDLLNQPGWPTDTLLMGPPGTGETATVKASLSAADSRLAAAAWSKPAKLEWDEVANMPLDEVKRRLINDFRVKPEQLAGKSKLKLKDMLCILSDKATGHAKRPEPVKVHIGTKSDFLKAGQIEHGTRCHLKYVECGRQRLDSEAYFYGPSRDGINQEVNGLVFSANGYQKQLFWSDIEECWFLKKQA